MAYTTRPSFSVSAAVSRPLDTEIQYRPGNPALPGTPPHRYTGRRPFLISGPGDLSGIQRQHILIGGDILEQILATLVRFAFQCLFVVVIPVPQPFPSHDGVLCRLRWPAGYRTGSIRRPPGPGLSWCPFPSPAVLGVMVLL